MSNNAYGAPFEKNKCWVILNTFNKKLSYRILSAHRALLRTGTMHQLLCRADTTQKESFSTDIELPKCAFISLAQISTEA